MNGNRRRVLLLAGPKWIKIRERSIYYLFSLRNNKLFCWLQKKIVYGGRLKYKCVSIKCTPTKYTNVIRIDDNSKCLHNSFYYNFVLSIYIVKDNQFLNVLFQSCITKWRNSHKCQTQILESHFRTWKALKRWNATGF